MMVADALRRPRVRPGSGCGMIRRPCRRGNDGTHPKNRALRSSVVAQIG
jgi:hypothetical protein